MSDCRRRLAVTIAAPLIAFALSFVGIPNVDLHVGLSKFWLLRPVSVVALGLSPLYSAFVLVEVIAFLVPAWRPLRFRGPDERYKLRRAALLLTFMLATVQSYFLFTYLVTQNGLFGDVVPDPSLVGELTVIATLVAGMALILALALAVDRHGLTNGVSVLMAGALIPMLFDTAARAGELDQHGDLNARMIFPAGAAVVAIVLATRAVLRCRFGSGLRAPTSGFLPLVFAATLPALYVQLHAILQPHDLDAPIHPGTAASLTINLVIVVVFTVVLSSLFQLRTTPAAERARALRVTLGYLVGISLLALLRDGSRIWIDSMAVIVATAIVLDVYDEWCARKQHGELVEAWPVHQVARVDEALAVLSAAGIPAYPRAVHHRTLLQFFGPFIPVDLLVPPDRVAETRELLEPIFKPTT